MNLHQLSDYRTPFLFCAVYAFCWSTLSYLVDPTVPYDAVEALNWAQNGEWGSPKNPWAVGFLYSTFLLSPSPELSAWFWYASHFVGIAVGLLGVFTLSKLLCKDTLMAWLAMLGLCLSGIINFDAIPYNDNFILFMLWPWIFVCYILAIERHPKWWQAAAFLAVFACMAKYTTFAIVGMMVLTTVFVPRLRYVWSNANWYAAMLLFVALVMPNIVWLYNNEFSAFNWVGQQVKAQFGSHALVGFITVYYPIALMWLFTRGQLATKPDNAMAKLCSAVLFLPLIPIFIWFTFHHGDRLIEWLHPFLMPALAILSGFLTIKNREAIRRTALYLGIFSMIVLIGYSTVYTLNVRNAATNNLGVKTLAQTAQQFWQRHVGAEVQLVGGSGLSEWLTFYLPGHPHFAHQWNPETTPNIYNRHITAEQIEAVGMLVVGKGACNEPTTFQPISNEWPASQITITEPYQYARTPGDPTAPYCLGIILPKTEQSAD